MPWTRPPPCAAKPAPPPPQGHPREWCGHPTCRHRAGDAAPPGPQAIGCHEGRFGGPGGAGACCCRKRAASHPGRPASDGEGRRETEEEALIRGVVEREVQTPAADEAALPPLLRAEQAPVPLAGSP